MLMKKKSKLKNKINFNIIYKVACLIVLVGAIFMFQTSNVSLSNEIVKTNSNPSKNLNIKVMNKVVDGFKAEETAAAFEESVAESTALEESKKAEEERLAKLEAEKQASQANANAIIASANQTAAELQSYAHSLVLSYGWTEDDFLALVNLWNKESGWRVNAGNASSGAYGIPQALPGSKMSSEGSDWATNGETQIRWGLKYIAGRYGSPSNAWAHFLNNNWY